MDPINTKCYTGTGITFSNLVSPSTCTLYGSTSYNSTTKSFDTNSTLITDNNAIITPTITFSDTNEFTLDFWVKLRSGATNVNSLCGRSATQPWILLTLTSTSNWFLRFRETSAAYNDFSPITNIDLQNWTNIVLVFKSNRVINLYTNGYFRESILTTPTNTSLIITNLAAGYSSGGNYYSLQGSISATKIYNKNLLPSEILQNYNALKSRFGL